MISSQNIIVYIGFCCSTIINLYLLYMIHKKTAKQIGNYKVLMQCFSILELMFSTVDVLNQPTIYVGGGSLMVFSTNPLHLNIQIAKHLNILNFTFSGMILSLLAIHFIYRYFAVCRTALLSAFDKPYIFVWIGGFFAFGVEWYTASFFLGGVDQSCSFDAAHLNETLDMSVFIGVKYAFRDTSSSRLFLCWKSIVYALILLKILVLSGTIVVHCGWKTYKEMVTKRRTTSRKTCSMQKQLFKALVCQTLVPTLLLYVPLFIMFILPIFGWTIRHMEVILLCLFVLYPILDPLVVLYLVTDYRRAVKALLDQVIINPLIKFLSGSEHINSPLAPYIVQVQQNNILY